MPNKKDKPVPKSEQAVYYVAVFIAAALIMWEKSKRDNDERLWWLLLWFAVMIVAFYRATRNWAHDNPKKNPLEEAEEEKEETPEIRDVDIPSLEEMAEQYKKRNDD